MAPGRIGRLLIKNRLIRAATSETMATDQGEATDDLVRLYSDLALGGAGLIITGHIYVEPRGKYEPRQLGLDHDSRIAPLARVTEAVHRYDGLIFAELSHAGSQSLIRISCRWHRPSFPTLFSRASRPKCPMPTRRK